MATCASCPRTVPEGERYCMFHKPTRHRWWPRWTRRKWYTIIAVVALVVLPIAAYFYQEALVGPVIYWLTAAYLLAYTYETYGLRVQMIRQNEISIRPLLITSIELATNTRPDILVVRNIGRGPALFVQIDDIPILVDDSPESLVVKFEVVDYIEPQTSAITQAGFFSKDGDKFAKHFDFLPNLNPKYAKEKIEVTLRYEDVDGASRFSVMQMGKPGIRLLLHDAGSPR
jgi:hypothetical protein